MEIPIAAATTMMIIITIPAIAPSDNPPGPSRDPSAVKKKAYIAYYTLSYKFTKGMNLCQ